MPEKEPVPVSVAELLSLRLEQQHEDIREMKSSLSELTRAINKLALVEERQTHLMAFIQQLQIETRSLDGRIKALEIAAPGANRTQVWVERLLVALGGASLVFVARKAGLL